MSIRRRSRSSQSGFTLTEVLVGTAIFAIILIAALLVYDRSNKVFKTGVEAAEMQQNTRIAFDRMVADLRLAGFDFDRDGVPTALDQAQQPDEQIEYAGSAAITFRSNFDYNDIASDHGREANLEPPADASSKFPIVTTANDEIVTYALVPDTAGSPTETLTFYADVTDGGTEKRQSWPDDGEAEDKIDITGVDLCTGGCTHPPYTLYRFTVNADGTVTRTPLANNIRDLQLTYYKDILGEDPLTITNAGGDVYDPSIAGSLTAAGRATRGQIRGVRVRLIGLNESPDPRWTQPGETVTSVKNRRQYALESLIAPRNLGKHGLREQATAAPGPPTLTDVVFNYCGSLRLRWDAPAADITKGDVETYYVLWEEYDPADPKIMPDDPPQESLGVGLLTDAFIPNLDPTKQYRVSVAATNSYGTEYAHQQVIGTPLNDTTPLPPTLESASGGDDPTIPAEANQITIAWTMPIANDGTAGKDKGTPKTPAGSTLAAETIAPYDSEYQGIEIWRGETDDFDPDIAGEGTKVATFNNVRKLTYTDTSAANCIPYWYRVRLIERCDTDGENLSGDKATGYSDYDPPVGSKGIPGAATSDVEPEKPGPLIVAANPPASNCIAGTCAVTMTWPEVKTDVKGQSISVATYEVEILQDGTPCAAARCGGRTSPILLDDDDFTVSTSGVTWQATNLPETDGTTTHKYTFSARAVQCGLVGQYSNSDDYPKCKFAGGATLTVSVSGTHGGAGTADDPYDVTGPETISFSVPSGTTPNLRSLTAEVYNADTSAFVTSLTPASGPADALSLTWPDATDGVTYRVDYTITDTATPDACVHLGSIYIKELNISCPFTLPITMTQQLAQTGSGPTLVKPYVEIALKNATEFAITLTSLDVTWDKNVANPSKNVSITPVTMPTSSGTTNATVTGSSSSTTNTTSSLLLTFNAASTATVRTLAANEQTGTFKINFTFDIQSNSNLSGQPFTNIVANYKLPGDALADTPRSCDIF